MTKGNYGWRQDDTQAAMLGLATIARDYVADRRRTRHRRADSRPSGVRIIDWVPDQDHGGNLLMAMQTMLVQADAGRIRVLPAWPKDWDVEFKLAAPHNTIVEGAVRGGKLLRLTVLPKRRENGVVVREPR